MNYPLLLYSFSNTIKENKMFVTILIVRKASVFVGGFLRKEESNGISIEENQ